MFGEEPPAEIALLFQQIGNPVKRMTEMYDLIGNIIQQSEQNLKQNHYTNYRILPKDFEFAFNQSRRKSSSEMDAIISSVEVEDPLAED